MRDPKPKRTAALLTAAITGPLLFVAPPAPGQQLAPGATAAVALPSPARAIRQLQRAAPAADAALERELRPLQSWLERQLGIMAPTPAQWKRWGAAPEGPAELQLYVQARVLLLRLTLRQPQAFTRALRADGATPVRVAGLDRAWSVPLAGGESLICALLRREARCQLGLQPGSRPLAGLRWLLSQPPLVRRPPPSPAASAPLNPRSTARSSGAGPALAQSSGAAAARASAAQSFSAGGFTAQSSGAAVAQTSGAGPAVAPSSGAGGFTAQSSGVSVTQASGAGGFTAQSSGAAAAQTSGGFTAKSSGAGPAVAQSSGAPAPGGSGPAAGVWAGAGGPLAVVVVDLGRLVTELTPTLDQQLRRELLVTAPTQRARLLGRTARRRAVLRRLSGLAPRLRMQLRAGPDRGLSLDGRLSLSPLGQRVLRAWMPPAAGGDPVAAWAQPPAIARLVGRLPPPLVAELLSHQLSPWIPPAGLSGSFAWMVYGFDPNSAAARASGERFGDKRWAFVFPSALAVGLKPSPAGARPVASLTPPGGISPQRAGWPPRRPVARLQIRSRGLLRVPPRPEWAPLFGDGEDPRTAELPPTPDRPQTGAGSRVSLRGQLFGEPFGVELRPQLLVTAAGPGAAQAARARLRPRPPSPQTGAPPPILQADLCLHGLRAALAAGADPARTAPELRRWLALHRRASVWLDQFDHAELQVSPAPQGLQLHLQLKPPSRQPQP